MYYDDSKIKINYDVKLGYFILEPFIIVLRFR